MTFSLSANIIPTGEIVTQSIRKRGSQFSLALLQDSVPVLVSWVILRKVKSPLSRLREAAPALGEQHPVVHTEKCC
jgi:hypothetical protein